MSGKFSSGVALELATVVATAALIAIAAFVADSAASQWQSAVRAETKWSAAAVESTRSVYLDEAPRALSLTQAEIRNEVYRQDLGTGSGRLRDESEIAGYSNQLARITSGQATAVEERYRLEGGGFDINARLGDLRSSQQVASRGAVEDSLAEGDARQRISWVLAWLCVPCVVGFIVMRRRRPGRRTSSAGGDPDLIPDPWQVRDQGWAAWGALAAWVLLALVPVLQIDVGGRAARADAEASRLATQIAAEIEVSQLHESLRSQIRFAGLELSTPADAREVAAVGQGDAVLARWAAAEREVVSRWVDAATTMTSAPAFADGIDPPLVAAINSTPGEWERLGDEQTSSFEAASRYGSSATFLSVAMLLAAMAATGFATVSPSRGRRISRAVSLLLLVCALTATTAGLRAAF